VQTLKNQHIKGREITAQLQKILITKTELDPKSKLKIKKLLQKFITMYRPHEARENTVLFPLVRSLMSEEEFKDLSEKFDDFEHELFGQNGFEDILAKAESLEKNLGIYNLEKFTPNLQK
jgi:hemerythrin-like domain-containing protein